MINLDTLQKLVSIADTHNEKIHSILSLLQDDEFELSQTTQEELLKQLLQKINYINESFGMMGRFVSTYISEITEQKIISNLKEKQG